ncbi:MAG TPA: glycosyltransferase family 39 protein [Anaerolineae bacterium]|nr:glycosyltransferase family 39 protein [Anaerolineae bacterium]
MMSSSPQRVAVSHAWLVVLIVLCAFALRAYRLDYFALRGDESFTVQFASLPAGELFEGIRSVEPNPPLYYYALRGWMAVSGQSEFAVRFFSLFFGVLSVPLLYQLGRSIGGRPVGVIAAGILAVNSFQIFHSQDVRNYTLWPMWVIAAWWCLWSALIRRRARYWWGYALFSLLGLYTHYYHAFVVLADNLFVGSYLVSGWRSQPWRSRPAGRGRLVRTWLLIQAALAAGLLIWLAIGSTRAITEIYSGISPSLTDIVVRTLTALTIGESVPRSLEPALAAPALTLIAVGLIVLARKQANAVRLFALGCVIPLVCVFVVSTLRPLYLPRYLNVTAPAVYVLGAQGFAWLAARPRDRVLGVLLAVAWLGVSGYSHGQALFNPRFAKSPDWRARAAYFESNQQPGDVIVQNYPDPSLGFYYHGVAPLLIVPTGRLDDARREEAGRTLDGLLSRYRRIWFMPAANPEWDSDGLVERRLARSADRVWAGPVADLPVHLYETPAVFAPKIHRLEVKFEQGITLIGYRLAADRLRPGESIRLVLYWQSDAPIPADYTVFTHLLDPAGFLRGQQDNAPVGNTYPTSSWSAGQMIVDGYDITLPADAPPGAYSVEVGLYDWRTQVRLRTAQGEDHVILPVALAVRN